MVQDAPIVPIYQDTALAVTRSDVSGVNLDITQVMYYWLISPPSGKDTLVVGTTDAIQTSLDPAEAWDTFGWNTIYNLGAPLVYIKPGSNAGPNDYTSALATNWTTSSDGLIWTFNLRQGVKFYDGTEFTANAVKYSFDRSMNLALPNGPQVGLGYSDIIGSVDVTSTYQVTFTLKRAFAPFLSLLAYPDSFIVNPKAAPNTAPVEYVAGNARASNPNDLGPYVLAQWTRSGGKDYQVALDANPSYFGSAPKAKHVVFKFYADSTSLALAINSGDVDMALGQLAPGDISTMRSDFNLKVWDGLGLGVHLIAFQESMPPFDNPTFRQTFAAAIDRKQVTDTLFQGQATPLYSVIPNGMAFHEDSFKTLGDGDLSKLVAVLHSMGYLETTQTGSVTATSGQTNSTFPAGTQTTPVSLQVGVPLTPLMLAGLGGAVLVSSIAIVVRRKRGTVQTTELIEKRGSKEGPSDVKSTRSEEPKVQQVMKEPLALPPVEKSSLSTPKTEVVISTGYAALDQLLSGGLPERYAILFASPSYDERDLLLGKIIESTIESEDTSFYVSSDAREDLLRRNRNNFIALSPQADKVPPGYANLFKIGSVGNLSDFNITLTAALRGIRARDGARKIMIIDMLSDILLQHKLLTTRRWLSDFLTRRKAEGFTILATFNPLIASKEEAQTIIDSFDGVIEIYERDLKERSRRFLTIKKMYGRRYSESELMLDKEKPF
jgi:ABC-type transport system substrate-binding protein/KaiC/GvpD/RAD55 family RecA-like ATPase